LSAQIISFRRGVTELQAEAGALEVWHGPNLYADFLRKHDRRPDPVTAATIGKLMGTRVRADDGSMQPKTKRSTHAPE
jgi:hypothetical protein